MILPRSRAWHLHALRLRVAEFARARLSRGLTAVWIQRIIVIAAGIAVECVVVLLLVIIVVAAQ